MCIYHDNRRTTTMKMPLSSLTAFEIWSILQIEYVYKWGSVYIFKLVFSFYFLFNLFISITIKCDRGFKHKYCFTFFHYMLHHEMQHNKTLNGFCVKFVVQNFIPQLDAITFSGIFILFYVISGSRPTIATI